MPKKRGRNQELEEVSRNAVRTALKGWVVNDLHNDFGLDFVVQLARPSSNECREITSIRFYVQLKASEDFGESDTVSWDFDVEFVESYWNCPVPVVLILYEANSGSIYWTVLQQYVHEELTVNRPDWWSQSTVRISIERTKELVDVDDFGKQISDTIGQIDRRRLRNTSLKKPRNRAIKEDPVRHLVNHQTSLVRRAEQRSEENKHVSKTLLRRLIELLELHDLLDYRISESTFTDPSSYFFEVYEACKRAVHLCEEIQAENLRERFHAKSNDFYSFACEYIIGNKYLNCRTGESFVVVDICELAPESDTVYCMALQQYEDGIPWDENAEAIAKRIDYQLMEHNRAEESTNLWYKCSCQNHDFGVVEVERDDSIRQAAFCRDCGLSKEVIAEFCGEKTPVFCEICGEFSEEYEFINDA